MFEIKSDQLRKKLLVDMVVFSYTSSEFFYFSISNYNTSDQAPEMPSKIPRLSYQNRQRPSQISEFEDAVSETLYRFWVGTDSPSRESVWWKACHLSRQASLLTLCEENHHAPELLDKHFSFFIQGLGDVSQCPHQTAR